jgi:hypothetical protein
MENRRVIERFNPTEVAAYLQGRGWVCVESLPGGSYWRQSREESAPELLLPLDSSFGDYRTRAAELVAALASYEKRSWEDIFADLDAATTDMVRLRFLGPAFDAHSVPLERGVQLYQETRELLLAAACAAVKPQRVYTARKPNEALQFLSQLQLTPPERGSYVIAIRSPVPPSIEQPSLPGIVSPNSGEGFPDKTEPFARQAISILGTALVSAVRAIHSFYQSDTPTQETETPFDAEVSHGLSANFCGALSQLLQLSQASELEISISGATRRPFPFRVQRFSRAHASLLGEVARRWRAYAPRDDFELRGTVVGLRRAKKGAGRVTIHGFLDDTVRAVQVDLAPDAYELAISAHKRLDLVGCEGELVREGAGYVLRSPRRFRLLTEGEPLSAF